MSTVAVPEDVSYIAVFLTFRCNFGCSYCINHHRTLKKRKEMTVDQWIKGLNRLIVNKDRMVPITLQGGEPTVYKGFYDLVDALNPDFYLDLLTNLSFDEEAFMRRIAPQRLRRDVPYASIRASYHHEMSNPEELFSKAARMQDKGYSVGIFAVEHPENNFSPIREQAAAMGLDFRTKEFLGTYKNKLYGHYKYPDAVAGRVTKTVQCRTTELLIAPDGYIHRCHSDLYSGINPVAHLLDDPLDIAFPFRECRRYGLCNPCDIKVKNNRFQQFGHCSVTIKAKNGASNQAA